MSSPIRTKNKFFQSLKNQNPRTLDKVIHELHDDVFKKIDCLDCANCCKTVGPLFTSKDITRISKNFKLSPGDFTEKYLRIDEDNDYVLKTLPCPFLSSDNNCNIYSIRPKACKDYPLTDLRDQKKLLKLHLENTKHCPAVNEVFNHITNKVGVK